LSTSKKWPIIDNPLRTCSQAKIPALEVKKCGSPFLSAHTPAPPPALEVKKRGSPFLSAHAPAPPPAPKFQIAACCIVAVFVCASTAMAAFNAETTTITMPAKGAVFMYGGVATSASLLNLVRVSIPDLQSYGILSVGGSYEFYRNRWISLQTEGFVTKYMDHWGAFSVATNFMFRWNVMPWDRWVQGSFGFGNGLSFATQMLQIETSALPRSTLLLYSIIIEFEFRIDRLSPHWSFFIRDQHRSGLFGVFDGVVGGSDFLCLGIRRLL
jgi:hypothetical protein